MAMAPSRTRSAAQLQAAVERLDGARLDGRGLVRGLARLLRAAVPADGLLLLRTDPTTVLPTDGVVEALPPALCKPLWDNELLEPDFNKFVMLARGPVAATLYQATGGQLTRSRRYRTLYQPLGVSDELRVAFAARDGSCWGLAQFMRTSGAVFTDRERDLVAGAVPAVVSALRARFAVAGPVVAAGSGGAGSGAAGREADGGPGPALVVLDKAGEVQAITPGARQWLAALARGSATGMAPVPEPVYTVAGRARAARAGLDDRPACAQVRTASAGWLHLHASCLDTPGEPDGSDGAVAVMITPAQGPDLVPVLALGYRLTHREQEVLRFLARGMSTTEITQRLGISAHTVRDHIKALFGKVGVRSRAELVGRIFAEHYFDRLEADVERW